MEDYKLIISGFIKKLLMSNFPFLFHYNCDSWAFITTGGNRMGKLESIKPSSYVLSKNK